MDKTIVYVILLASSTIISIVAEMMLLPRIIYTAKKRRLLDMPNYRKLHTCPIPRLGGVSFLPVILLVTLLFMFTRNKLGLEPELFMSEVFAEVSLLVCGMIIVYLLGIYDDLIGVLFKKKFLVQIFASAFIIGSGVYIKNLHGLLGIYEIPTIIGILLSVLIIVFTTNALNLIDGADGLASGLGAFAFSMFGLFFLSQSLWVYAVMAFSTVGLLIPFFYYNFFHTKRKIFMGDTGSLTMGYLLAFMLLRVMSGEHSQAILFSAKSAIMILAIAALYIPLYDAIRVMVVRILSKRSPFSPDRNHIHHKLIDLGYSKKRAVGIIIIIATSLFASNCLLLMFLDANIVLLVDLFFSVMIGYTLYFFTKKKYMNNQESRNSKVIVDTKTPIAK